MSNVKVFISYSHESEQHKERVLRLANLLRSEGIDVKLDQYERGTPTGGWPKWIQHQIKTADFVLLVCTEAYRQRVEGCEKPGEGLGVGWESTLYITSLYSEEANQKRVVPILFSDEEISSIPLVAQNASRYHVDTKEGYEGLYRHITNQPLHQPPELGPRRILPAKEPQTHEFSPSIHVTPLPEPSFQAAANDTVNAAARAAQTGLRALNILLNDPGLREAAGIYRGVFEGADERIHTVIRFKDLHDRLHDVHRRCYSPLLGLSGRFPQESALTDARLHARKLHRLCDDLSKIIGSDDLHTDEYAWIRDLEAAASLTDEAISTRSGTLFHSSIRAMSDVLEVQPSRLNLLLTQAVTFLDLGRLIRSLTELYEGLRERNADPYDLDAFARGIESFRCIDQRLNQLSRDHTVWQAIDDQLRLLEGTITNRRPDLEKVWARASRTLNSACKGVDEGWAEDLLAVKKEADDAMARGDRDTVKVLCSHVQTLASDRFYNVDKELKQFCEQLRAIGTQLLVVIGKLK